SKQRICLAKHWNTFAQRRPTINDSLHATGCTLMRGRQVMWRLNSLWRNGNCWYPSTRITTRGLGPTRIFFGSTPTGLMKLSHISSNRHHPRTRTVRPANTSWARYISRRGNTRTRSKRSRSQLLTVRTFRTLTTLVPTPPSVNSRTQQRYLIVASRPTRSASTSSILAHRLRWHWTGEIGSTPTNCSRSHERKPNHLGRGWWGVTRVWTSACVRLMERQRKHWLGISTIISLAKKRRSRTQARQTAPS